MNRLIIFCFVLSVLIGCAGNKKSQTTAGKKLLHHSEDSAGRDYFPLQRETNENPTFVFSPKYNAWAAYSKEGLRVKTGRGSGGANFCKDLGRSCKTPTGKFSIKKMQGGDCTSNRFPLPNGGAKMPYCMHFYGPYAIHGSKNVPHNNVSHGCVRIMPSAAQWLNEDFLDVGSEVIIEDY